MTAALACAAMILILAGTVFCAAALLPGHPLLRARWAWRCRGCPPRNDGDPLEPWERGELITITRGWGKTARPERTRT